MADCVTHDAAFAVRSTLTIVSLLALLVDIVFNHLALSARDSADDASALQCVSTSIPTLLHVPLHGPLCRVASMILLNSLLFFLFVCVLVERHSIDCLSQ